MCRAATEAATGEGIAVTVRDRFSLRNVYMYLVCLVTLIMVIFSAVSIVRNVTELVYPDPGAYGFEFGPSGQGISEAQREKQIAAQRDSQRRNSVVGLVGGATLFLIAGPVYLYHWRKVQSELPGRVEAAGDGTQPTAPS
jgi:hypothetical protein